MSQPRRFYVTTPIYYVNDAPHIGHSYTTILADVLARYHRFFGDEVRFQTGTDEHGQKVQQSAQARGISPQEQCDLYSQRFRDMWTLLEIVPDRFIRTTEEGHKKTVQAVLQRLYDQGEIYKDTYSGWYNVADEMFISDSDVTDEGKETGRIIHVSEDNYFFRLTKYRDWLLRYLQEENPGFILPETRRNEVLGLLKGKVQDLCISRPKSRLEWGIELPFDRDYVTYVWFDALINYISGLGWPDSEEFEKWWPEALHLIGKDILKPHGFFWPIMLKAAGIPLPKRILAHGWWTRGGHKESKTVTKELASQAPVRHIRELVEDYGVDPIRYYLIREMTLGMDQEYSEEMIVRRLNSDLANDLGNLLNRVVKLLRQYFDSKVPPLLSGSGTEVESRGDQLRKEVESLADEVRESVDDLKPNLALEKILNVVRKTNTFVADCEPWKSAKNGNMAEAGHCLSVALRCLRTVALLLQPVMPRKMESLLEQIGCPVKPDSARFTDLDWTIPKPGTSVPGGDPLFPRIDWKAIRKKIETALQEKSAASVKPEHKEKHQDLVTIEEFFNTKLRVAEVLEAEKVPDTSKLLRLKVSLGEETRQIVAGIAEYYQPEELIGKQIILVANMKPTKIRGIESQGMLLAARDGKNLRLLTLDGNGISPGAEVA